MNINTNKFAKFVNFGKPDSSWALSVRQKKMLIEKINSIFAWISVFLTVFIAGILCCYKRTRRLLMQKVIENFGCLTERTISLESRSFGFFTEITRIYAINIRLSLWRRANARNVSFRNSWWTIYVINSVDKTKLCCDNPTDTEPHSL